MSHVQKLKLRQQSEARAEAELKLKADLQAAQKMLAERSSKLVEAESAPTAIQAELKAAQKELSTATAELTKFKTKLHAAGTPTRFVHPVSTCKATGACIEQDS